MKHLPQSFAAALFTSLFLLSPLACLFLPLGSPVWFSSLAISTGLLTGSFQVLTRIRETAGCTAQTA